MRSNQWSNLNKEKQLKTFIRQLDEMYFRILDVCTFEENKNLGEEWSECGLNAIAYLGKTKHILKKKYELLYGEYRD